MKMLDQDVLADNFLDSIHIGKISENELDKVDKIDSSLIRNSHPQQITDFNLWNRSFSLVEMIAWTSCK